MRTLYALASEFAGSGIGRTASHAALGLWRNKHLSKLVALGHRPTDISNSIIHDVSFLPRRSLFFLSDKPYYELKNRWFDYQCKKHVREGFDTFHCWNSQASNSLTLAKKLGLKSVVDRASSHIRTQTEILLAQYAKYGIDYHPTYEHVVRRCEADYENADLVVTPSPFSYKSFADQGFDMSKVVFNPFGVDLEKFAPRENPPDEFRVIFVGQVGIRKGVPALLQAWDMLKLKNSKLVLVGSEEPVAHSVLAPYRNRADIDFVGPSDQVSKLMAQSSIFVFPSCEEGSALVTYEALACGLPVVATFNSGSVVEDGKSGMLVKLGGIEELASKIETFYRNPDLVQEMSVAARALAEQYPWEAYGDRTARMHEGLHRGDPIAEIHKAMGVTPPAV